MEKKEINEARQKKTKNCTRRYVIFTYLFFWIGISLVAVAYLLSNRNDNVMNWCSSIASWTPTIVLMVMFHKLFPNRKRLEWLKEAFTDRIKPAVLLIVTVVFIAIYAFVYLIMLQRNSSLSVSDFSNLTVDVIFSVILFSVIQGATGEESGWRGYLQRLFESKNGGDVIKAALLVGVIWSFWHTPLWFVTGLQSFQLFIYIVTFIAGNISLAVIIGVCYNSCRNLLIPIWIHFLTNALGSLILPLIEDVNSSFEARCLLVAGYMLAAVVYALWYSIRCKRKVAIG